MAVLKNYFKKRDVDVDADALVNVLTEVNRQIGDPHYEIGISFFLKPDLGEHLEDIWRMEIEPYLEEYFFDQSEKVDKFRWERIQSQLTS